MPKKKVSGVAHSCFRKNRGEDYFFCTFSSTADSKISDVAFEKIPKKLFIRFCNHFFTAVSTSTLMQVFSNFVVQKHNVQNKKKSSYRSFVPIEKKKKSFYKNKKLPLGIQNCGDENWINALMQFIIYIPSVCSMFDFAPKSLSPFKHFIDRYKYEQVKKSTTTQERSSDLKQCLIEIFSKEFFFQKSKKIDLLKILLHLMRFIKKSFSHCLISHNIDLLAYNLQRLFIFHKKNSNSLEELIEKNILRNINQKSTDIDKIFPELFVAYRKTKEEACSNCPQTQYFIHRNTIGYELDAFIICRIDPRFVCQYDYITYIKLQGSWYQCDDECITPILSNNLKIPLSCSVLLHYKQIEIEQPAMGLKTSSRLFKKYKI